MILQKVLNKVNLLKKVLKKSKFIKNNYLRGWREKKFDRHSTDHVTWGPMRGLEKNCTGWRKHTNRQTHGHGDPVGPIQ